MRIVDRETFLALPGQVLFCSYTPCAFGELTIRVESLYYKNGSDYVEQSLTWLDGPDQCDVMTIAEDDKVSVDLDLHCAGRASDYDTQMFAVFEDKDIDKLIDRLKECKCQ